MKTLRTSRSNAIRQKILEELKREFDRMGQSRVGRALKRGAIGTSNWGRRVGAKTGRAVRTTTRTGWMVTRYCAQKLGRYSREQARERERTRPAREAAKAKARAERVKARQARAKQRATRAKQRSTPSRTAWIRNLRSGNPAGRASGRAAPPPRTRTPRPAQAQRASRNGTGATLRPTRTASGQTGRSAPAARPARPARAPRAGKTG
jgi:hypothetical protein